jgi:hypothetical protein
MAFLWESSWGIFFAFLILYLCSCLYVSSSLSVCLLIYLPAVSMCLSMCQHFDPCVCVPLCLGIFCGLCTITLEARIWLSGRSGELGWMHIERAFSKLCFHFRTSIALCLHFA